ncbi:MAG: FAD-dependent oxidoreductase [Candidatus Andersenbacteria bacterium]|nr:FAD-dependent oxidoreductase [Candidatus Andersenbacteria bacterium]
MYDLIVLGAGPAGLSASIYASRYKINHIVVGNVFDGSLSKAHKIENWPGEKSIKGSDLIMKFYDHAKSLGLEIIQEEVVEISKDDSIFIIKTNLSKVYKSKAILITLGTKHRKLNISGEKKFLGKGVSYCAVCDGAFFKDKTVAVAGGSNSAAMAAEMLSEYTEETYIIYRKESMRCEPVILERLEKNPKIEIIYDTNVTKVTGDKKVELIEIDNKYNGSDKIKLDGLFIEVGLVPFTSFAKKLGVKTDKNNYIVINQGGATNVTGVYAAGDITNGSDNLNQIVTAVSEGAIAATNIYKYLKE